MIDYFALALTHGLILIALIRLVQNAELDSDPHPDEAHSGELDNLKQGEHSDA